MTTVRLRIPAKPEYLVLGRLALSGLARVRSIADEDLADLKLALTEACTNSIRHAYGEGGGPVEIRFELDDDAIAIEVLDDGAGFDRPSPRRELELEEGGLGLAIIEAVVDRAEFGGRADGRGSRIRFVKQLGPAERKP